MSRLFGIAGVQMSVVPWDHAATLRKMEDVTKNIARSFPWVQMIIFPELAVTGLTSLVSAPTPETWKASAQPIPGLLTDELCALAQRTRKWLVPGSLYETEGDKLYNTAIVISPEGQLVAKYRKMFPWRPYETVVAAGTEFCVFDIPEVGRFGLCICYDQWFPEVARTLTWLGAEVILQPTLTTTPDRVLELVVSQANAIFNQCYFVGINGVGAYGGGQSLIVDPEGRILQQAGAHDAVLTELLDLDNVTRVREYGNFGMSQTLKQLRDSGQQFPIYTEGVAQGEGFKKLGQLRLQRK